MSANGSDPPMGGLLEIMRRLRDPQTGCPWDREQTFASISAYTLEEAYEVADAIERQDMADLREELGDLLLQVVYHSQMAEEIGAFTFTDVARTISDKMIRRHPHVFGDAAVGDAGEQTRAWEAMKAQEREAKSKTGLERPVSVLDGVALALPAMVRAVKLSKRAASVGFVWPTIEGVLEKLEEEISELQIEITSGNNERASDELGDVLFVCANIARHLDIDPEAALRGSNAKFDRRFRFIEDALTAIGSSPTAATLEEMEHLWQAAKASEKATARA